MKTATKERPILFSAPMVRAILEGRKTVTRRIVKPQPKEVQSRELETHFFDEGCFDGWLDVIEKYRGGSKVRPFTCPFGVPGDWLWVRETWRYHGSTWSTRRREIAEHSIQYEADASRRTFERPADDNHGIPKQHCRCKPPGPGRDTHDVECDHREELRRYWARLWPAIFLPRWASRLTLEVVSVRVERLQEITEEDAKAEGIGFDGTYWRGGPHPVKGIPKCFPTILGAFSDGWDSLHGPGSWDVNPWVWRIAFRRLP